MRRPIFFLFLGNLVSKALGLLREVLTAALFGTGPAMGAFRVAQTGTLTPINFFISDSLNSAFIPQYKQFYSESADKAKVFFWALFALFSLISFLICLLLWIGADQWVKIVAPGLDANTASLVKAMLRIMALGVPFYILSSLLFFLGMANDDFLPMTLRPIVQNVGMIAGVLTAFLSGDVLWLAWGFSSSYVFLGAWVALRYARLRLLVLPEKWVWPQVRGIMKGFWRTLRPLLVLPIALQGNIVVERAVASLIGLTAVSALDYAKLFNETLIVLVSVPVAFAGLANWSGRTASEIHTSLRQVVLLLVIIAAPVSAFLASNAYLLVEAVFMRGAFDGQSAEVTADIMRGASIGLWAQVIGYVLIKALNAQMRNYVVVRVMVLSLLANATFNFMMYPYLGAFTLGLGNSVYGLILFVGAVTVLGLWKDAVQSVFLVGCGAAGYCLLTSKFPLWGNVWKDLLIVSGFSLVYWVVWIGLIPFLRNSVIEAVAPNWKKAA